MIHVIHTSFLCGYLLPYFIIYEVDPSQPLWGMGSLKEEVTQGLCIFLVESVGIEKTKNILLLIHFLFLPIPFLVIFWGIRSGPLISKKIHRGCDIFWKNVF